MWELISFFCNFPHFHIRLRLSLGLKQILFVAVIPLLFLLLSYSPTCAVSSNVSDSTRILRRRHVSWMVLIHHASTLFIYFSYNNLYAYSIPISGITYHCLIPNPALKYSTAVPVIFLSALKYHVFPEQWVSFYRPLWLISSVINSLYSFYWDIKRDWDLRYSTFTLSATHSTVWYTSNLC